jgi:hypothetical protein
MIIIAFDSMEKAKAFQNDPSQKDIDANRMKNTKSRVFPRHVIGSMLPGMAAALAASSICPLTLASRV